MNYILILNKSNIIKLIFKFNVFLLSIISKLIYHE